MDLIKSVLIWHFYWIVALSKSLRQKKSYVIEVQDHQQALKYANPIVDLEDTVRRGISDPLADPRFVINSINNDFFGTPVSPTLANDELLAFRGANLANQQNHGGGSIIGVNTNALGLHPDAAVQQHAVKEEIVARHPTSIQTYDDAPAAIRHPGIQQFHGRLQNSLMAPPGGLHPNLNNLPQSNILQNGITQANVAQNSIHHNIRPETLASLRNSLVGRLPAELPSRSVGGSIGSSDLKRLTALVQRQGVQTGMQSGGPNNLRLNGVAQLSILPSLGGRANLEHHSLLQHHGPAARKIQPVAGLDLDSVRRNPFNRGTLHVPEHAPLPMTGTGPASANNINPLTGLPEDLEDRSYGAVSSISVAETPQVIPTSITVNTGGGAEVVSQPSSNSGSSSASAASHTQSAQAQAQITSPHNENVPENNVAAHTDVSPANPDQITGKDIETNFSDLKSFLEADDILRDRLGKDGIDTGEGKKSMQMRTIHRKHFVPKPGRNKSR